MPSILSYPLAPYAALHEPNIQRLVEISKAVQEQLGSHPTPEACDLFNPTELFNEVKKKMHGSPIKLVYDKMIRPLMMRGFLTQGVAVPTDKQVAVHELLSLLSEYQSIPTLDNDSQWELSGHCCSGSQ